MATVRAGLLYSATTGSPFACGSFGSNGMTIVSRRHPPVRTPDRAETNRSACHRPTRSRGSPLSCSTLSALSRPGSHFRRQSTSYLKGRCNPWAGLLGPLNPSVGNHHVSLRREVGASLLEDTGAVGLR